MCANLNLPRSSISLLDHQTQMGQIGDGKMGDSISTRHLWRYRIFFWISPKHKRPICGVVEALISAHHSEWNPPWGGLVKWPHFAPCIYIHITRWGGRLRNQDSISIEGNGSEKKISLSRRHSHATDRKGRKSLVHLRLYNHKRCHGEGMAD